MSKLDEKMRDKAAIYLEEMGVSGDAQVGIDAGHAPHKEMIGGAYHIHDLIADYAQSQLQELREQVEDRISDIRDDIYEIEGKMNRYRFSEKEKKEGSTYYGGLQERESKYKRQIGELKFVLKLIDQLQE